MTQRLTVLRVIARLNIGGPARHVTILDRGLRDLGFETLLAHGDIDPDEASLERLVDATGVPTRRIAGLGRRVNLLSDARAFVSLVRLVFRLRPDVVHTHTAKAGTLGRLAAFLYNASHLRVRRCLVVHTFHGHVLHGYFGRVASAAVRLIERSLGRLTDCVFVLSPRQRRDIGERYRIASTRRLHIVPLGLDLGALTSLPVREGTAVDVVFGFVGRLVAIKNVPLLIDAFAIVHRETPSVRLLIAGDGELKDRLRTRVAGHGLTDAVEFVGWRDDLPALYEQFDLLVLSSINEGTPVAAIEAMAAGRPVVSTAVGGVPDLITDGQTGLLVPSKSVEQLAAAMLKLAGNPALRARMGSAAREVVRERYSAERLVSDVARVYRAALEEKRFGPLTSTLGQEK